MNSPNPIRLRIPRQDLESSSFFTCKAQAAEQWVTELPKANIGQTTRLIYQAISELNRVRLLPDERLNILEALRGQLHYVTRALSKHYLNQPIILPAQARKVSNLCMTLHQQLATGYAIVASHVAALGKRVNGGKPDQLIAKALCRAINESTANLINHYQLYEPAAPHLWQQLHQYYALAFQSNALKHSINDEEMGSSTIHQAYIRALLLGACKPNQLRQEDFKHLMVPLNYWSEFCQLYYDHDDSLFVINTKSDGPPLYREAYSTAVDESWLGLDTRRLIQHLHDLREAQQGKLIIIDSEFSISSDLLGHLYLAWGEMSKRTFMRLENNDALNLSIGLSATHHFISGQLSFDALLEEGGVRTFAVEKTNPFLKAKGGDPRQKDVWDSAYESNIGKTNVALESIDFHIHKQEDESKEDSKYRNHHVMTINASAHGYCIAWPEDDPVTIKAGEIAGIQSPHSHNWSVAVIRWVSNDNNQKTQIGLELISPSASPYGARIMQRTGPQSEFLRVLVLPDMPSINIPVTLITPRVPFKEGQKVTLNQQGKLIQVQLTKKLNETGAYNRFEFRKLAMMGSASKTSLPNTEPDNDQSFDSLWKNL